MPVSRELSIFSQLIKNSEVGLHFRQVKRMVSETCGNKKVFCHGPLPQDMIFLVSTEKRQNCDTVSHTLISHRLDVEEDVEIII